MCSLCVPCFFHEKGDILVGRKKKPNPPPPPNPETQNPEPRGPGEYCSWGAFLKDDNGIGRTQGAATQQVEGGLGDEGLNASPRFRPRALHLFRGRAHRGLFGGHDHFSDPRVTDVGYQPRGAGHRPHGQAGPPVAWTLAIPGHAP